MLRQIHFRDARGTSEPRWNMSYIFPRGYLSGKYQMYANSNHYASKQPVLSPDRKLEPDDRSSQAEWHWQRQHGCDVQGLIFSMIVFMVSAVHLELHRLFVHSAPKTTSKWKKDFVIKLLISSRLLTIICVFINKLMTLPNAAARLMTAQIYWLNDAIFNTSLP